MSEQTNLINTKDESSAPRWFKFCVQPCLAELIGTALFVSVGCLCVNGGSVTGVALTHGFMIMVLIASFGHISGGHFNPAVTLGVALSGSIPPLLAVAYVFCQLLGGLLGAGMAKGALPLDTYNSFGGGAHDLGAAISPGEGILCEMILTAILVTTVLMTALDTDLNKLAPIAIGFSITVDILAGAGISGASMNPARSFGPAVAISPHTSKYWTHHYVYWVGPTLGSALASVIYKFLMANDQMRLIFN